jgi:hypothetical protein
LKCTKWRLVVNIWRSLLKCAKIIFQCLMHCLAPKEAIHIYWTGTGSLYNQFILAWTVDKFRIIMKQVCWYLNKHNFAQWLLHFYTDLFSLATVTATSIEIFSYWKRWMGTLNQLQLFEWANIHSTHLLSTHAATSTNRGRSQQELQWKLQV